MAAIMQSSNSKENMTSLYYLYPRSVITSQACMLSCGRIDKRSKTPIIPVSQLYEHLYHPDLLQPIRNTATLSYHLRGQHYRRGNQEDHPPVACDHHVYHHSPR